MAGLTFAHVDHKLLQNHYAWIMSSDFQLTLEMSIKMLLPLKVAHVDHKL